MNPDSKKISNPEERDPTIQDLVDIRIKAENLGRGDLVHKINNYLNALEGVTILAKEKGWDEKLRKLWNERVVEINKVIAQVKMEQAKEKGLL